MISQVKKLLFRGEFLFSPKNKSSKIVYYHDLFDNTKHPAYTTMATNIGLFCQHLDKIKKSGFNVVSKITKQDEEIMIVFDDGWQGFYEFRDFFHANNIYPTVCMPASLVGLAGYLTKEQLQQLHNEGFGIASHSWTHQSMTNYNNQEKSLLRELYDSKSFLEDIISAEIDTFCYPQGMFSRTIYYKTLEFGYREIFSCIDGNYFDEFLPNCRRRNLIQFSDIKELECVLFGANKLKANRHIRMHYSNF